MGGNEWNYKGKVNINLNEHEEHEEEEEEEDLSRTALIVKIKSQSKSVMDAGGGTGSNPFPSLQEPKQKKRRKIKIWGPYTETPPYEERKGQFILLSLKRKREKNIKNTNTLNMDVACEAIDGLALLYLGTCTFGHTSCTLVGVHTVSEFE